MIGVSLAAVFRQQAEACARLGSPMYADLCAGLADDLEAGGPTADVCADHVHLDRDAAPALRLLGGLHARVLERSAGALATFYPSVGGVWEPVGGLAAARGLLADEPGDLRRWLDRPPQTNEVGRATALVGGLLHLPAEFRRPLRLVEIGASAGLLLRPDHLGFVDADGRRWGPPDASLVIEDAWSGARDLAPWPDLVVRDRIGGDLDPIDPTTSAGRLTLSAYTWPDQRARWERLRGALRLAEQVPARVRRIGAGDLLEEVVDGARAEDREGCATVVWHSVMRQYLPAEEDARVAAALDRGLAAATADAPFVHLALEPGEAAGGFEVRLRAAGPRRLEATLGVAHPHGVPVRWDGRA